MLVIQRGDYQKTMLDFSHMTDAELFELRAGPPIEVVPVGWRHKCVRLGIHVLLSAVFKVAENWDLNERLVKVASDLVTTADEAKSGAAGGGLG